MDFKSVVAQLVVAQLEEKLKYETKERETKDIPVVHTVDSLTVYAREWIRDLQTHIVERNGIYEGKIV